MKPLIALLVLALAVAGGLAWRAASAAEARRAADVEASQVRGWARSSTAAGMSVLPKRVPAASKTDLRRVEGLPGFHEYAMRCSSCHVLPAPAAYDARRWIGKVDEMRAHTARSGIMPPPEEEMEMARRFLQAASDTLRGNGS
jgi:hypothetical protein